MHNESPEKRYVAVGELIRNLAELGFFSDGKVVLNQIKDLYNRAAEGEEVPQVFSKALKAVPKVKDGFVSKLAIATVSTAAEKLAEAGFLIRRKTGSKTEYFLASDLAAIEELESYDQAIAEAVPSISGLALFGENYLPLPREGRQQRPEVAMDYTPDLVRALVSRLREDPNLTLRVLIWSTSDPVALARRSALRVDLDEYATSSEAEIDRAPIAVYGRIQTACTELLATRRSFRRLLNEDRIKGKVEVRETASWQSLPKLVTEEYAIAGEYFVSTSSHKSPGIRYSRDSLHYQRIKLDFDCAWGAVKDDGAKSDLIALTQPLPPSDHDDPEWSDLVAVVWQSALDNWHLRRVAWRPKP